MEEDFSELIREMKDLKRKNNRNSLAILIVSGSICLSDIFRLFL